MRSSAKGIPPLVALLFLGMGGWDFGKVADPKILGAIFIGVAVIVFFVAAGSIGVGLSSSAVQIIFAIVVLAIAIAFITK